jgi:acetone carboxylase gamma subunit
MKMEKSGLHKLFTGTKVRSIFCPECKFNQEIEEKLPNIGILEGFDRSLRNARK